VRGLGAVIPVEGGMDQRVLGGRGHLGMHDNLGVRAGEKEEERGCIRCSMKQTASISFWIMLVYHGLCWYIMDYVCWSIMDYVGAHYF